MVLRGEFAIMSGANADRAPVTVEEEGCVGQVVTVAKRIEVWIDSLLITRISLQIESVTLVPKLVPLPLLSRHVNVVLIGRVHVIALNFVRLRYETALSLPELARPAVGHQHALTAYVTVTREAPDSVTVAEVVNDDGSVSPVSLVQLRSLREKLRTCHSHGCPYPLTYTHSGCVSIVRRISDAGCCVPSSISWKTAQFLSGLSSLNPATVRSWPL